jgi:hypothetical protein
MPTLPSRVDKLLPFAQYVAKELKKRECSGDDSEIYREFRRALTQTEEAQNAWSAADSTKVYSESRMKMADREMTAWLAKARLVVMLARGEQWTREWIESGSSQRAAGIPKRIGTKMELARRAVFFLSRHPEFGVAFAGVTAERGRSIYERIIVARDTLDLVLQDWEIKKQLRNAAKRLLQRATRQILQIDSSLNQIAFGSAHPITNSAEQCQVAHSAFPGPLVGPMAGPLLAGTGSAGGCTVAA